MDNLNQSVDKSFIHNYIQKMHDIIQSGEEFPIDLDEVWMFYHSSRDSAIHCLRYHNFVEGIDYQIFRKKSEKPERGRPYCNYKLSVSCFENFYVRKVRWLFDIYCKIFRAALTGQLIPTKYSENPVEEAKELIKQAEEYLNPGKEIRAREENNIQLLLFDE